MSVPANKEEAREQVRTLVRDFRRNVAEYTKAGTAYNETQARTDFITPLLEAFGWDVHNRQRHPLDLREVFEEATIEVGEERLSKKPDYELRLARQRKLFIEAKKPSVRIGRDKSASFQTRRYGFSASLPISVLTNFHELAIYDCVPAPLEDDEPHVARLSRYSYEDFEKRFDELYDQLSREAVYSGKFDEHFKVDVSRHGTQQFDAHFLKQVRSWRLRLATDIHANKPELTATELTFAVQLFLSRIVFLRICEDRDIEKYETLKAMGEGKTFEKLMQLIQRADQFYDSGLFRLLDDERLGVRISDKVLAEIIKELYYPQSPYTFSVVEAGVLGEIYEQFLGEVIVIGGDGNTSVALKPEVRESGGVVPTPKYVVDAILERTLAPALKGRDPTSLKGFTIADICCGSGVFPLGAYEYILNHHLNWYMSNNRAEHVGSKIYEVVGGRWRLKEHGPTSSLSLYARRWTICWCNRNRSITEMPRRGYRENSTDYLLGALPPVRGILSRFSAKTYPGNLGAAIHDLTRPKRVVSCGFTAFCDGFARQFSVAEANLDHTVIDQDFFLECAIDNPLKRKDEGRRTKDEG